MNFSHVIIGGGFAGLSLAHELILRGLNPSELLIIDSNTSQRGSNVPMALVHPFPGRSLKPAPGLKQAWKQSHVFLEAIATEVQQPTFSSYLHLIRPFTHNHGKRLESSFLSHQAILESEFQTTMLDQQDLKSNYPFLKDVVGAIQTPNAQRVNLRKICQHLKSKLMQHGVCIIADSIHTLKYKNSRWYLNSSNQTLTTTKLVLAPGAQFSQFFPNVPSIPTLGHIAIIEWPQAPVIHTKELALSLGGHLFPLENGRWLLGATYFTPSCDVPNTTILTEKLMDAVKVWLPSIQSANVIEWWSGIRSILLPNRLPMIGSIPDVPHCHIIGGFGSKGGLWVPLLAKQLAQKLLSPNSSLPNWVEQPNQLSKQWTLNTNLLSQ